MTNAQNKDRKNLPDFYVFSRKQISDEKSYLIKLGAAWFHSDSAGLSISIDVMPLNFDGKLVLREPLSLSNSDQEETEYEVPF